MRALAAIVLAASSVGAGCGASDPCAGRSGLCLTLEVRGDVGSLDALAVKVSGDGAPANGVTDGAEAPIDLPVQLALLLPGDLQGALTVEVTGSRSGIPVAGGSSPVTVPPSGQRVIVDLAALAPPLDGSIPDGGKPTDAAIDQATRVDQSTGIDQAAIDSTGVGDLAAPPDLSPLPDLATGADLAPTAPVLDSVNSAKVALGKTLSWPHVVGVGTDTILLVAVATVGQSAIQTVTYGGVAMTQVNGAGYGLDRTTIYFLAAPAVGNHMVLVTDDVNDSLAAASVSLFNASQFVPSSTNTFAMANPITQSIGSGANHLVVGAVGAYGSAGTLTSDKAQTDLANLTAGNLDSDAQLAVGSQPGMMATTMNWTEGMPKVWVMIIVDIAPP